MSSLVPKVSGYRPGKHQRPVFFNADGTLGETLRVGEGGAIQDEDGTDATAKVAAHNADAKAHGEPLIPVILQVTNVFELGDSYEVSLVESDEITGTPVYENDDASIRLWADGENWVIGSVAAGEYWNTADEARFPNNVSSWLLGQDNPGQISEGQQPAFTVLEFFNGANSPGSGGAGTSIFATRAALLAAGLSVGDQAYVESDLGLYLCVSTPSNTAAAFRRIATTTNAAELDGDISFLWSADGDTAGVFYWLGTARGTSSWVNPVTLGALAITTPSCLIQGPGSSAAAMVDRNYAQYHYLTHNSGGSNGPVVVFDLGADLALRPTRYTIKSSNSGGVYWRNWRMFGHNGDFASRVTLDARNGDTGHTADGQWISRPVLGGNSGFYRYVGFELTGATSNGDYIMRYADFEIYGDMQIAD